MPDLPDFSFETDAMRRGHYLVAGIDEVGRGPLAGPVTAAAVCLDPENIPPGLNDSKLLTRAQRESLSALILASAEVAVAHAEVEEIEAINILQASHLAMCRALDALPRRARLALVDGPVLPPALRCAGTAIVGGDGRSLSIAAASIVAKVTRDRLMAGLALRHPGYGWERNAGYATKEHRAALLNLGITPAHRRTFAPVHHILWQDNSLTY